MTAAEHPSEPVRLAQGLVDRAERIVVLTGAGISTDSGIADAALREPISEVLPVIVRDPGPRA